MIKPKDFTSRSDKTNTYEGCIQNQNFVFSSYDTDILVNEYKEMLKTNIDFSSDVFFEKTERVFEKFSEPLKSNIMRFCANPSQTSYILIEGLSIGKIPPTPNFGGTLDLQKRLGMPEVILSSFANSMGHIVGYKQFENGSMYHHVLPLKAKESKQTNKSSQVYLEEHNELTFHPEKPDWFYLLGLRQDPNKEAETILSHSSCIVLELMQNLTADEFDLLFDPVFECKVDYEWDEKGAVVKLPILYGGYQHPMINWDRDLMFSHDDKIKKILKTVNETIVKNRQSVKLKPGDLLIVNNRYTVHSRSPFKAYYDGTDRWIMRSFGISNINSIAAKFLGPRIISTRIG